MANDYLNKATDNVNLEIQTARTSLAQAIKQVELTGSSLEKARENEQKALERYEEGKSPSWKSLKPKLPAKPRK